MPVALIKLHSRSPRLSKVEVRMHAASIRQLGFVNPVVVDNDLVVILGTPIIKACKYVGLKVVPTIIVNDLTEEQVKALRTMDQNSKQNIDEGPLRMLNYDVFKITDKDLVVKKAKKL